MMSKKILVGMTLEEIAASIADLDLPKYSAREIALWIYRRGAYQFDQFTNISKLARQQLSDNFLTGLNQPLKVNVSADGTKKYLFAAKRDHFIETAYIPETRRNTLCISSQAGCKFGCSFCMTARQGFQGHLSSGEILNQLLVYMSEKKLQT